MSVDKSKGKAVDLLQGVFGDGNVHCLLGRPRGNQMTHTARMQPDIPIGSEVEIFLVGKNLVNPRTRDGTSTMFRSTMPSSYVMVFQRSLTTSWIEIGRTEVQMESPNPSFIRTITTTWDGPDLPTFLKFEVWHEDVTRRDELNNDKRGPKIGKCEVVLQDLVQARANRVGRLPLLDDDGKENGGSLTMMLTRNHKSGQWFQCLVSATGLMYRDHVGHRPNPYFELMRYHDDGVFNLHQSDAREDTRDPEWWPLSMSTAKLCGDDMHTRLIIKVYDFVQPNDRRLLGETLVTPHEALLASSAALSLPLFAPLQTDPRRIRAETVSSKDASSAAPSAGATAKSEPLSPPPPRSPTKAPKTPNSKSKSDTKPWPVTTDELVMQLGEDEIRWRKRDENIQFDVEMRNRALFEPRVVAGRLHLSGARMFNEPGVDTSVKTKKRTPIIPESKRHEAEMVFMAELATSEMLDAALRTNLQASMKFIQQRHRYWKQRNTEEKHAHQIEIEKETAAVALHVPPPPPSACAERAAKRVEFKEKKKNSTKISNSEVSTWIAPEEVSIPHAAPATSPAETPTKEQSGNETDRLGGVSSNQISIPIIRYGRIVRPKSKKINSTGVILEKGNVAAKKKIGGEAVGGSVKLKDDIPPRNYQGPKSNRKHFTDVGGVRGSIGQQVVAATRRRNIKSTPVAFTIVDQNYRIVTAPLPTPPLPNAFSQPHPPPHSSSENISSAVSRRPWSAHERQTIDSSLRTLKSRPKSAVVRPSFSYHSGAEKNLGGDSGDRDGATDHVLDENREMDEEEESVEYIDLDRVEDEEEEGADEGEVGEAMSNFDFVKFYDTISADAVLHDASPPRFQKPRSMHERNADVIRAITGTPATSILVKPDDRAISAQVPRLPLWDLDQRKRRSESTRPLSSHSARFLPGFVGENVRKGGHSSLSSRSEAVTVTASGRRDHRDLESEPDDSFRPMPPSAPRQGTSRQKAVGGRSLREVARDSAEVWLADYGSGIRR